MKENESVLPPCVTCIHAHQAEGYVEFCRLYADDQAKRYEHCVQAGARMECNDYQVRKDDQGSCLEATEETIV